MTIHLPKVNEFGGGNGGGGGSSSFPVTVTDSGSVLPATTGYNAGDKFLDTTSKKIYTVLSEDIYTLNNATSGATINKYTGVASGFSGSGYSGSYISKPTAYITWYGDKTFNVHFKLNSAPTDDKMYVLLVSKQGYSYNPYDLKGISVYIKNKKIHFCFVYSGTSPTYMSDDKDLFNYELSVDTEYYLTVKKEGTSFSADLFTGGYNATKVATHSSETSDYYVSNYGNTQFWYGCGVINGSYMFSIGDIFLVDSYGDIVKPDIELSWDDGVEIEDSNSYLSIEKSKLYFYKDEILTEIVDLTPYRFKAETITIDTASVSITNIKANANYVLSNNSITAISFGGCETSFEETTIEFSTGNSVPTVADSSGITWMDGFVPSISLQANKSYLIVIFNKLGFVKEY